MKCTRCRKVDMILGTGDVCPDCAADIIEEEHDVRDMLASEPVKSKEKKAQKPHGEGTSKAAQKRRKIREQKEIEKSS